MALELCAIAFDCPDPRALAEFYGRLLGWEIDEDASDDRWVELADPGGGAPLAFQRAERYRRPTWPDEEVPQQVHVDIAVESLQEGHELAIAAGADSCRSHRTAPGRTSGSTPIRPGTRSAWSPPALPRTSECKQCACYS